MKLYDIKKGSKIKCEASDGSTFLTFDHIDGMYSYCVTEKGGIVHLHACTPLKRKGKFYIIEEEEDSHKDN